MNRHTPALITLRLRDELRTLRDRELFGVVWDAMAAGRERFGGRLVHFSTQSNHIHMIVEAENEKALSRFMSGLEIRIARALNRYLGRSGAVFADRYHPRILRSPRQTRNALNYLFNNDLHHKVGRRTSFDFYSSAPFFDGFNEGPVHWPRPFVGPPPCVPARAWLLREGWRRAGPITLLHAPPT